jgi:hypothetical protein
LKPNLRINKSQHLLAFVVLSLLMARRRVATEQAALLWQRFMSITGED